MGMFYYKISLLITVLFFLGCSTPQPQSSSADSFAKNAIMINYSSSKDLNLYDNEAHVTPLVVYQLNDINAFNTLKKDKDGIIKLLSADKFDKSVMSVSKFFIRPNSKKQIFLDRASGAKWVCLVAGYYDMQVEKSTLIYPIPSYSLLKFYESEQKQTFVKIDLYFDKSTLEKREE